MSVDAACEGGTNTPSIVVNAYVNGSASMIGHVGSLCHPAPRVQYSYAIR